MATTVGIQIPNIRIHLKTEQSFSIKWFGIQMTSADRHFSLKIKWGSEYWTFWRLDFKWLDYSFSTDHLNVLLTNGRFSNDWAKAVTMALVPTIWKPDIQNVRYLFSFKRLGCLVFKNRSKTWGWTFSQKNWIWEGVRREFGLRLTAKL